MTENNFSNTVESLFKGMDSFITTKTVVGDAVVVNEHVTILPLVDVSFGVGAGAFGDDDKKKNTGAGGMGGKITPSSVLVQVDLSPSVAGSAITICVSPPLTATVSMRALSKS